MNALIIVLLSVAGGAGASTRLVLGGFIRDRVKSGYPIGTTVINVTGSLLLGLITGLAIGHVISAEWLAILGVGFFGGYTTFSTASFETVRLIQDRRFGAALANGLGMLLLTLLAAGAGMWLGLL